jgi:HSP90 family molecular chaperone
MENIILKTGFDNSINNSSQSEDYELQMMSLMAVFMENAVKTAEIYTKHSNRKIITSIDILLGLKKELFTFLDNDDIEERALEIFNKFKNKEFLSSEEEDNDEDEDEDEDEEDEEEDEEIIEDPMGNYCHLYDSNNSKKKNNSEADEEEFKKSECECEVCKKTNECAELWKTWKPSNRIEEILYSSIQNIDNKFNLNS